MINKLSLMFFTLGK